MKKSILAIVMAMVLCISLLAGCSQSAAAPTPTEGAVLVSGGVLVVKVNPEIAVEYDANGLVAAVTARNEDALAIIQSCGQLIGKETRVAVAELVTAIGDAGYFVDEIDGEHHQIVIEIEAGSKLPRETFLDEVVSDVRERVNTNDWKVPTTVENATTLDIPQYVDTDYGPGNDGYTDYDDTDYGPNNDGVTDFGKTDYNDTDYGPNNDGITDYDDTDYGPNNDGVTDYKPTTSTSGSSSSGSSKSSSNKSNSSKNNTDYGKTDYGKTDYDKDSGKTDYGKTDYDKDSGKTDYGKTDYGKTDYDD